MGRLTKYLVQNIGGVGTSGKTNSAWFYRPQDARAEVKRRLGLERLHEGKRLEREWYPLGANLEHDGHQWSCVAATHYDRVPPSHPEHGRKGGVRVYSMERETLPFDPSSLKFGPKT